MRAYLGLLSEILHTGEKRQDRTGVGTYGLFGKQLRLSLKGGVWPCLTTKKVHVPSVVHELLWFLSGDTNVQYLQKNGVRIWNAWADPKTGDLGPIYGAQWRRWSCDNGKTIDQISQLIEGLKKDPFSRRHLVVAYNPGQVDQMALPPCHAFFQFYVSRGAGKGPLELSCQLYQRSADIFLGVPFNIASYTLLTHMVAHVCGFVPKEFVHSFGDVHLYLNHIEQARTQLQRKPGALPRLWLSPDVKNILDFKYQDIKVLDYRHQASIPAPVAV